MTRFAFAGKWSPFVAAAAIAPRLVRLVIAAAPRAVAELCRKTRREIFVFIEAFLTVICVRNLCGMPTALRGHVRHLRAQAPASMLRVVRASPTHAHAKEGMPHGPLYFTRN